MIGFTENWRGTVLLYSAVNDAAQRGFNFAKVLCYL